MGYKMVDRGYPYKIITSKRKDVGRVYKHADGHWIGMIGKDERKGATPDEAFRNVAAVALGFNTLGDLRAHNQAVRADNRARRQDRRQAANSFLQSDDPLARLMRDIMRTR
jgi:hypothetical protein